MNKDIQFDKESLKESVREFVSKEVAPDAPDPVQSKLLKLIRPSFTFRGQHETFVVKKPSVDALRKLTSGSLGNRSDMMDFLREVVDKPEKATLADLYVIVMAFRFQYNDIEYVREYTLPGRRKISFDEKGVHVFIENDEVSLEVHSPPIPVSKYYEYRNRTGEGSGGGDEEFLFSLLRDSSILVDGDRIPSEEFERFIKSSEYGGYMSILIMELFQKYIFPDVSFNGDPPISLLTIFQKYFEVGVLPNIVS